MRFIRKFAAAAAVSAGVALSAGASHAAITEYFNEAAFLAAAGSITTENFNDATLNSDLVADAGGFVNGTVWQDAVATGGTTNTYAFTHAITAFGGFWDEAVNGYGQGLTFTLNFHGGGSAGTGSALDNYTGFYGVISTQSFDSVLLEGHQAICCAETYSLDDLHYSSGAVPEPATWAIMLVGFGGMGAALRRRRVAVAA